MMIKYDENGLIPVITQDVLTKEVLILSYMNQEAYEKTLEEGALYYYSRSRQALWKKGETSGNTQQLISLTVDCDQDALLAQVIQKGPACHKGTTTCFEEPLLGRKQEQVLKSLMKTIEDRKINPTEGYTNYLFTEGKDKILKKVGEESAEVIIASKNNDQKELICELSDLIYHAMVLMVNDGISLNDIMLELKHREK